MDTPLKDWTITKLAADNNQFFKYVFSKGSKYIITSLYTSSTFEEQTIISCSTSCGCAGGCIYCPYSTEFFIKLLSIDEITQQVTTILEMENIKRPKDFRIIFGDMGDPLLNWTPVESSINALHSLYPYAKYYIITIAPSRSRPYTRLMRLGHDNSNVNIIFSTNESTDAGRDLLIPYHNKLTLRQIRDMGTLWYVTTHRPCYISYITRPLQNVSLLNADELKNLFSPVAFQFIFNVSYTAPDPSVTTNFAQFFDKEGYTNYIINPAKIDTIPYSLIKQAIPYKEKKEDNDE